jgi:hypothetical protein
MRLLRPTVVIAALLIITFSTPPSLLSQSAPKPSQPKQPAPPKRQTRRPQRADALAPAINELLKLDPLAPESLSEKNSETASASSEEETKLPDDDAPIKELIAYWSRNHGANPPKPSDKVRRRLLEACEDRPELTRDLIDSLLETTDAHDRLYKLLEEDMEDNVSLQNFLRRWLQHNSRYFRDDLIAEARGEIANETSSGESLWSLARLDWEAARSVVEAFASAGTAQMAPVALSLLYERAQAAGDSAQAEKYRALLQAIVADRRSPQDARRTALLSLVSADWKGQEDWVVSLFADPTLGGLKEEAGADPGGSKGKSEETSEKAASEVYGEKAPNILSFLLSAYPERWFPVISNMVGHNQHTVHRAAVRCLAECLSHGSADKKLKKEIAQKLAPWLTDPNWADADDRSGFIQSLIGVQAPELPPGLLWVLEYDEDQDNRATAAEALTQYHDPGAIPALRRALEKEEDEYRRRQFVTALAECGGLSDDETAAAIEAYAIMVTTKAGAGEINQAEPNYSEKPLPLQVSVGRILSQSGTIQAAEGLVIRLIERAKSLRASQPAFARQILRSVEAAPLPVAEVNLVERIGAGWADLDALKLALKNRDSLQKGARDELYSMVKQGGYAVGVAAAILNEEREHRETLRGSDAKAQLALIAGASYLRDKLPVELVAKLLNSPNRALSKAAERYLEIEDSAEARKRVLARHRGEAYIIGDGAGVGRWGSVYWEELARKEIKSRNDLEAIYGLAQAGLSEISGVIIRVRGGKAEISLYEAEGRRDVRALTESEFEELKSFTSRREVEDLGPESYTCSETEGCYYYLRLTKDGGRRIMLGALRRAPINPTLHEELSGLFYRLSKSGEFVTRYAIEDKIPGVEVLLADKKQEAIMVCGEGREIRVLIGEKGAEYKRGLAEAMPEWREFSSGKPGKVTDDPSACPILSAIPMLMKIRWDGHSGPFNQPTRVGSAWVYSLSGEDAGIWKFEPGTEPAKIISGPYSYPVVTPDGKWLVAIKTTRAPGEDSPKLVRHNLQTGEEFPVTKANGSYPPPIMYVAAHGKALLGFGGLYGEPDPGRNHYLLDPETGTIQQVKGEFGPLMENFVRELQPTGNPNEFWAAIPDSQKRVTKIGRYDSMNFVFKPLVELTGLELRNSDFWVDANAGKIWLTYRGQLLRLPLPAQMK